MRIPMRKAEKDKRALSDDGPIFLTPAGIKKMEQQIVELTAKLPSLAQEVRRTQEMGDLSENAAYQAAKQELRRTDSRIFTLKERLKRAVAIEKSDSESVQLGSTVVLEVDGNQKTFEIVGPHETNPMKGRISHVSPLGSALTGKSKDETISLNGKDYRIIEIR